MFFTSDTISFIVNVENTGSTYYGKDVVQVYFSAPYYDGGIEKSAIELGAYAKTKLLAPGESENLTISFSTRDMSSYDMDNLEAYVLEAGNYRIMISKNVHTPVYNFDYTVTNNVIYDTDEVTEETINLCVIFLEITYPNSVIN